jgi:hypothetical protein
MEKRLRELLAQASFVPMQEFLQAHLARGSLPSVPIEAV